MFVFQVLTSANTQNHSLFRTFDEEISFTSFPPYRHGCVHSLDDEVKRDKWINIDVKFNFMLEQSILRINLIYSTR